MTIYTMQEAAHFVGVDISGLMPPVVRKKRTTVIPPAIAEIIDVVCRRFQVERHDILCRRRHRSLTNPRHVAFWLAKNTTSKSYPEIARVFDNRDHTTVMAACAKIDRLIESGSDLGKIALELKQSIMAGE